MEQPCACSGSLCCCSSRLLAIPLPSSLRPALSFFFPVHPYLSLFMPSFFFCFPVPFPIYFPLLLVTMLRAFIVFRPSLFSHSHFSFPSFYLSLFLPSFIPSVLISLLPSFHCLFIFFLLLSSLSFVFFLSLTFCSFFFFSHSAITVISSFAPSSLTPFYPF